MLTETQKLLRDGKLTASRVGCLMRGDEEEIYNLWLEMIGSPDYKEPDFSDNWAVQLGSLTEHLNLQWYKKKHGPIYNEGTVFVPVNLEWAASTVDAMDATHNYPVECKHVNAYRKLDDVIEYYMPQLHWQMICTVTKKCAISVIIGANEPVVEVINYNDDYAAELVGRAATFMACVKNLIPPVKFKPAEKVIIDTYRQVDMSGNNTWANYAEIFLETKEQHGKHEFAKKQLKEIIEIDVNFAYGHGIEAKRDKRGITIKERSNV